MKIKIITILLMAFMSLPSMAQFKVKTRVNTDDEPGAVTLVQKATPTQIRKKSKKVAKENPIYAGYATVTLTAGDVWGDGTGYQMLLDADATAYGSIIPETGPLNSGGDVEDSVFAEFEYTIPENADGALSTSNIVFNNSITILIPAGTYDWCITNPTPGGCMWIASENGSVGGRANDFEFVDGYDYEFIVSFGGSQDRVDLGVEGNSDIIQFADSEVKRICVENWDTDGDGELSYDEAAGVDDIGRCFESSSITTFNELEFFTELTKIGEYAFDYCRNLTNVTFPTSLETIEYYAFDACNLLSLYIPESVGYIDCFAFDGNGNLSEIKVDENNPYYDSRDNCNAIIETASNALVKGCNTTVIPKDIVSLGWSAFQDMKQLKTMLIPEGVVDLGDYTFYGCSALEELSIPSTVSRNGFHYTTFYDCTNLKNIYCYIQEPAELPHLSTSPGPFGSNYGPETQVYEQAILHVPAGTKAKYETTEGWNLFNNIVEMESDYSQDWLSCPDNHHPHLIDLGLPSGTKWACCNVDTDRPENQSPTNYGGHYAWGETSVKGSYTVYDYAHFDIDEDNFIYIGEHISSTENDVAHKAWKGEWRMPTNEECEELLNCVQEEATINGVKGLKFIGPNDNSIFLPYAGYRYEMNLSDEGSNGWYWTETYSDGPSALAFSIPLSYVNDEPREVGHSVRPVMGDDPIVVPAGIQFADSEVERICVENWDTDGDGELSYDEADNVHDLGDVFQYSSIRTFDELQYFTELTEIGTDAFEYCTNLTTVTFPRSLESIGYYAFTGCNLLSLYITENVRYINSFAFDGNSNLSEIKVDGNNPYFDSRDNCNAIIETASNALVKGCNTTIIPEGVTSLGWSAFQDMTQLTTIHIPEGVVDLGDYTFYDCSALEELSIPSTVSPNGFHYTTFYDCTNLKNIYCYIQEPAELPHLSTSPGPFGSNYSPKTQVYEQAILHVPAGTKAKYETTDGWNLFAHIVEMGSELPPSGDQIIMERKYLVKSDNHENYSYQQTTMSLDNNVSIQIRYHNGDYWNSSWNISHLGVFIAVNKDGQEEEWYICPRVRNEWIDEKIIISDNGVVKYFMNGQDMGSHYFSNLNFNNAASLALDFDPYGWWYTHYHYMDDLKIITPAGRLFDDFNDGVLNPDLWQTPVNPDGVREEDGIMKMEQIRTDQNFHLLSQPISLIGEIPTDGLVAYYPFQGNADDESGFGNHGSPTNSVVLTEGVQGDANGAYFFGGYDNPGHIFVPNSESLQFNEGATFSLYIKPTSWLSMNGWGSRVSENGVQCMLAKEHDRRGVAFLLSGNSDNCSISTGYESGQEWCVINSNNQLSGNYLNHWTHVAIVYGNGHAQLYVDGKLLDDHSVTPNFSRMNQMNMYIGKYSDSWYPFNGAIDEVRVYNRALSATEILSLARFSENNAGGYNPSEKIQFADANVKQICVEMWDTNGDSELSYAEAAAVKDITGIFSGKDITSFDELQYFTSVTDPGDYRSCSKLTSIVLPPSIEVIHHSAFKDCISLSAISLPAKVREIQWYAFQGCYNMPAIEVDESNPYFCAVDGVLFSKDMTQLVIYPDGKPDTSYHIPDGVTTILEYSFLQNNSIEAVHLPASLTNIVRPRSCFESNANLAAFYVDENNISYCSLDGVLFDKNMHKLVRYPTGKKDVTYQVPEPVSSTGDGAFALARFLEQVSFSNSFGAIGSSSLSSCANLTTVVFPSSLYYIGEWAFYQSTHLQKVISYVGNPFEINENVFMNMNSETGDEFTSATLYVPYGTKALYEATPGWNKFTHIVEMDFIKPFEVQPENPEMWNELAQPMRLIIQGEYKNVLEKSGVIEYDVENSGQWTALTGSIENGETFTSTIETQFNPSKLIHVIDFRAVDADGLIIPLETLEYYDVRNFTLKGIKDMIYTGNPVFQDELSCEVAAGQWTTSYSNNVNVGQATVNLEGVFPYTIGRNPFYFNILPQPISGSIIVDADELVFNREYQYPAWHFTNDAYNALEENKDYRVTWENNFLPGTATLIVKARGNYEGELSATFTIKKAPVTDNLYNIIKPASEINYDGEGHGVEVQVKEYVGVPTVTYVSADGTYNSTEKPVYGGEYDAYLEIAEGEGYLALEPVHVASFVIYQVSEDVWAALQRINNKLGETASRPWDFSTGMKSVFSQPGLSVEKGLVTKINLAGKAFTGQIPEELFWLPDLQRLDLSGNQFEGDVASQLNTFMKDGGSLAPHLTYIDISGNRLTGNIGAFAADFDELQTLYAHDNGFSTVEPMISPTVTTLTLRAQHIADVTDMSVADLVGPAFIDKVPTVITYNHAKQTYDNSLDLLLISGVPSEADAATWGMQVNVTDGVVKLSKYGNLLDYHGENGGMLYLATGAGSQNNSWVPVKLSFEKGDANFSGDVNVLDLQSVINYIFDEYQKLFNYTAADLKADENINLLDIIGMVNTLMDMDLPTQVANHAAKMETDEETESAVYCDNGMLYLSTSRPVAAFDIFVSGCLAADISQTLETAGMNCTSRQMEHGVHIIGYSMNGAVLPEGTTAIARLTGGNPLVAHAMLSDQTAEEISVLLNQDVTGLNQLASNMEVRGNAEGIVLMTKKNLAHVSWSLYSLDGNLVDRGELNDIAAGHYLLHPRSDLRNLTWIVKVAARGEKEITKKINIR